MTDQLNCIITKFGEQYKNILANYYPAHGRTGFTERNLSVNFSRAIEFTSADAFSWYEVPLSNKKAHYDAMVVDKEDRNIYIIESKRFSNPPKKLREVAEDISRITDQSNLDMVRKELKMPDKAEYTTYGVILADVWLETDQKEAIFSHWRSGTFFDQFKSELTIAPETMNRIVEPQWFICEFDEMKSYKLLVLAFRIAD